MCTTSNVYIIKITLNAYTIKKTHFYTVKISTHLKCNFYIIISILLKFYIVVTFPNFETVKLILGRR